MRKVLAIALTLVTVFTFIMSGLTSRKEVQTNSEAAITLGYEDSRHVPINGIVGV